LGLVVQGLALLSELLVQAQTLELQAQALVLAQERALDVGLDARIIEQHTDLHRNEGTEFEIADVDLNAEVVTDWEDYGIAEAEHPPPEGF